MASITVHCPHCMTRSSYFFVQGFTALGDNKGSLTPKYSTHWSTAICGSCHNSIIAYFNSTVPSWTPDHATGSMNQLIFPKLGTIRLVGYLPTASFADCPEDCPPNVARAFIDAEKARLDQNFSLAVAGYRKAVDRAITPLVSEAVKSKMLGNKLGDLEAQGWMPEAMIDWIRLVKDDGNFALHDDDRDFDTADEIEPTREFTITLLNYLFTMPAMVQRARASNE